MARARNRRTYRIVDGERIPGTWRPVFIRNGLTYVLDDLLIFADGAIYCWEWVDLAGRREKLATGWVATRIEYNIDSAYWSGGSQGRNWLGACWNWSGPRSPPIGRVCQPD